MKIAFDCTSTQPTDKMKFNGGGEYTVKILYELLKHLNAKQDKVVLLTSQNKGVNEQIGSLVSENIQQFKYTDLSDLNDFLSTFKGDLIYFPICYPLYSKLKLPDGIRVIGGIHDMSSFFYARLGNQPGRYYKKDGFDILRRLKDSVLKSYNMKKSLLEHKMLFHLNNSTYMYTVSYYTKSVLQYYLNETVTNVFYSPLRSFVNINPRIEREFLKKCNIESKQFFLLSSISRWFKNNVRVILALDELFSSHLIEGNYKVVLLGSTKQHKNYFKKKIKNYDHFIVLDFISTEELEILYKNAYALIYPSLLEGFGYPPIEAMRHGTLSICSTSTSIPEICGEASIYFNPTDSDSIKAALLRAFDLEYYNSFKCKMAQHYDSLSKKQTYDLEYLIHYLLGV